MLFCLGFVSRRDASADVDSSGSLRHGFGGFWNDCAICEDWSSMFRPIYPYKTSVWDVIQAWDADPSESKFSSGNMEKIAAKVCFITYFEQRQLLPSLGPHDTIDTFDSKIGGLQTNSSTR